MNHQSMVLHLPGPVAWLLAQLNRAGYAAYAVGGCVRDSLLGRTPGDWDICTSALPEETQAVFSGQRLLLTGLKHGTVTVLLEGKPYEITTFRVDGGYADHRHPDAVRFVPRIEEDLARRDFTVNAMAWHPDTGLVDCFGGRRDLDARLIRCVGQPDRRFAEDALRILRAVRFAAQLGFRVEALTAQSALALRDTVQRVSAERIFAELDRLLTSPAAGRTLAEYGAILVGAIPEIEPCIGCTQPGKWHCYDVWRHTAVAVGAARAADLPGADRQAALRVLRWTLLLHDIAKPACRLEGPDGAAHFPGHNGQSARMADRILRRLKAPNALRQQVVSLVAVHDCPLPVNDTPATLRLLGSRGEAWLTLLCAVKRADLDGHARNAAVAARRAEINDFEAQMHTLARTGCYTLRQLKITGGDVLAAGIRPGPAVGTLLHSLLEEVMDGTLPNEKAALLDRLKQL
ncbi:HD domain-containing protein [uncultured Gemmiger sp.]|uniref:CCA tRNA nucleotidyltransferase n=1 Tax=uncultured Gemmiger sp. TaxID=1623490 RepID=UPI0025D731A8|nr:HD domain-containing protein [uncultured Gemmiger sp.]